MVGERIEGRALVDVFVYVLAPDEATPPAMVLNPLLDAIEAVLAPGGVATVQTLGGVAEHA